MEFYHGTRKPFTKNGYLFPVDFHGEPARAGHRPGGTAFIYFTTDKEMAAFYAVNSQGRGKPKILTVQPVAPIEPDNSVFEYEQGHQYRSTNPAKVIAVEIIPDQPIDKSR